MNDEDLKEFKVEGDDDKSQVEDDVEDAIEDHPVVQQCMTLDDAESSNSTQTNDDVDEVEDESVVKKGDSSVQDKLPPDAVKPSNLTQVKGPTSANEDEESESDDHVDKLDDEVYAEVKNHEDSTLVPTQEVRLKKSRLRNRKEIDQDVGDADDTDDTDAAANTNDNP